MGMPVSCFSLLCDVAARRDYRASTRAEAVFRRFKRFAFVIHDPAVHVDFDEALNTSFRDLDEATGRNLLFFALVRPENANVEGLFDRPYFRYLHEKVSMTGGDHMRLAPQPLPASRDTAVTAWTLAHAIGVSPDMLPCIVTSTDLCATDVAVHRSSAAQLFRQLWKLGHDADPPDAHVYQALHCSVAETLCVVLGAIQSHHQHDAFGGRFRIDALVARTLRTLASKLKDLRSTLQHAPDSRETLWHNPPCDFSLIDRLSCHVAGVLALLAERSRDTATIAAHFNSPPAGIFESETKTMLRTGALCFNALNRGVMERMPVSFDYAPSLICFAKAFENEMNLSLVQLLRERNGIEMPYYFCRHKPGHSATLSLPNGQRIDLNARNQQGGWHPPGLGQSEAACLQGAAVSPLEEFSADARAMLGRQWPIIRRHRNEAAHPTAVVERQRCAEVMRAIEDLMDAHVFAMTAGLKNKLRPPES